MRTHGLVIALFAAATLAPAAADAQDPPRVYSVTVSRGMLGFYSEALPGNGLHQRIVVDVVPDSPAGRAGLEKGDTLLRINGLAASPQVMSAPFEPGDTVVLRIRRDGREREITVVATERPTEFRYMFPDSVDARFSVYMDRMRANVDSFTAVMPRIRLRELRSDSGTIIIMGTDTLHVARRGEMIRIDPDSIVRRFELRGVPGMRSDSAGLHIFTPGEGRVFSFGGDSTFVRGFDVMATNVLMGMRAVAGAELAPLNPSLAEYFGTTDGVLVLNAAERTPAERAGLRGGDVIVSVGSTPVRTIRDLRSAIEAAGRDDVTLRVLRHGRNVDVTLSR
ncbi:MAG TPA: PDZ domain-containing protein [Longimicrobiales bacterium]|nr:PDZ domain-containing protein [Longimicrobiales bacterium]